MVCTSNSGSWNTNWTWFDMIPDATTISGICPKGTYHDLPFQNWVLALWNTTRQIFGATEKLRNDPAPVKEPDRWRDGSTEHWTKTSKRTSGSSSVEAMSCGSLSPTRKAFSGIDHGLIGIYVIESVFETSNHANKVHTMWETLLTNHCFAWIIQWFTLNFTPNSSLYAASPAIFTSWLTRYSAKSMFVSPCKRLPFAQRNLTEFPSKACKILKRVALPTSMCYHHRYSPKNV